MPLASTWRTTRVARQRERRHCLHREQPLFPCISGECPGLGKPRCHGFLDENRLARLQPKPGMLEVIEVTGGNVDNIDVARDKVVVRAVCALNTVLGPKLVRTPLASGADRDNLLLMSA